MEIALRQPAPGDIGWLISAHGSVYARQFDFDAQFEVDIAGKVAAFYQYRHELNTLLIAHVDGARAGSVAVSLRADGMAFINFLLVLEEYRGQGVARRLCDAVIGRAREFGMRTVRLETYSCLTAARELYRRYGFRLDRSTPNLEKYGQRFDREFWELLL